MKSEENPWIVFGGWGVKTEILQPLFGPHSIYVDVHALFPSLVCGDQLKEDWKDILTSFVRENFSVNDHLSIAGWSTGAILAFAFAQSMHADKLLLLSGTPSFCRRQGFPYGWKFLAVHAMQKNLLEDKEKTLKQFAAQIGLGDASHLLGNYATGELCAGLTFLAYAHLFPVSEISFDLTVVNGTEDTIIPLQAGRVLCEQAKGRFVEVPGNHTFFMGAGMNFLADII
jgi:pimeloyl-ACP methyl ester carboxylesterase